MIFSDTCDWSWDRLTKVVQTTLSDDEYKLLAEVFKSKRKSIKDGVRETLLESLKKEISIKDDPFFKGRNTKPKRSGKADVSGKHDEYLYSGAE